MRGRICGTGSYLPEKYYDNNDIAKIVDMAGKKTPYNSVEGKINIVSVGRLYIEKHFEDVVFVSRRLLNEYMSNFHWYLIGDGDLYDNLSAQIEEQGVGEYVTLLGKMDKVCRSICTPIVCRISRSYNLRGYGT